MRRVGLYIDLTSLYFGIQNKHRRGVRLDYKAYLDYCTGFGELVIKRAYGYEHGNTVDFKRTLLDMGITPVYSVTRDQPVRLCLDVYDSVDNLDMILLGTADVAVSVLLEVIKKPILVVAANIPESWKERANCIEIPSSMVRK